MRKKDQINLESKIKTVRFIGEKFVMCELTSTSHGLQKLSANFYGKIFNIPIRVHFSVSNEYSSTEREKMSVIKNFF